MDELMESGLRYGQVLSGLPVVKSKKSVGKCWTLISNLANDATCLNFDNDFVIDFIDLM